MTEKFRLKMNFRNCAKIWYESSCSDGSTLQWENGRSERITRGDDRSGGFWSSGGRSGPQPETGGECLAILNNVYNDGIKWHDVACSHTKPTICEE